MPKSSLIDFEEELAQKWADDPVWQVGLTILQYLRETPSERLRMLTLRKMAEIVGRPPLDEELVRALAILVGSSLRALEERLMFIDDEGNEFEVDPESFASARRTGHLVHPDTGETVDGSADELVPFFVPSEEYRRLKGDRS